MTRLRAVPQSGTAALAERVLADLDGLFARLGVAYRSSTAAYHQMSASVTATDTLAAPRPPWLAVFA